MTSTYGYITTVTGELAPCPVPRESRLRRAARVIANVGDIMQHLMLPAALIVLMAAIAAAPTTTLATPHPTASTNRIVVCDQHLSRAAMANAQQVGPAPSPSFCSVGR